ncbi:MAG: 8-oxo-dGTP diphosphatase [Patescibacteria group bacterium]|nr:8-oxo-dGTP diphosphatase [Patescibacteria group bacterium]MDD5294330.1 8-oxo-dGTP diphosphatase [Patescibacteria group bacterium]MDD5554153.1 8-oxo-dGTP diphosphatase [Patescibacteria group bacterium]
MDFSFFTTHCYILNEKGEVLLQCKSRGFGEGKWNGPGGKKKPDETFEESAIREVKEETGVTMKKPEKLGELEYIFVGNETINTLANVFVCRDWEGEPKDMGEGELKWFKINEVPLDKMWDDDQYWLKPLLSGQYQHKRFYFDKNGKVIKYEEL